MVTTLISGNLTALFKKEGRCCHPITVDHIFDDKQPNCPSLGPGFAPIQLDVGIKEWCKSTAHTTHVYTMARLFNTEMAANTVAKIDTKNLFNTIYHDQHQCMLLLFTLLDILHMFLFLVYYTKAALLILKALFNKATL